MSVSGEKTEIRDRLLERYMAYDHAVEQGDERGAEAIKAEIAQLLAQQHAADQEE